MVDFGGMVIVLIVGQGELAALFWVFLSSRFVSTTLIRNSRASRSHGSYSIPGACRFVRRIQQDAMPPELLASPHSKGDHVRRGYLDSWMYAPRPILPANNLKVSGEDAASHETR